MGGTFPTSSYSFYPPSLSVSPRRLLYSESILWEEGREKREREQGTAYFLPFSLSFSPVADEIGREEKGGGKEFFFLFHFLVRSSDDIVTDTHLEKNRGPAIGRPISFSLFVR